MTIREYYRGQGVEVRNVHQNRETWRPAKIHSQTSRGCMVIYSIGPQTPQHIMFADIRPMEKSTRERPQVTRPLLTAEDIEAINARAEAEERERKQAAAAAPTQPAAAPAASAPPAAPVPPLTLVPNQSQPKRAPRKPHEHHATPLSQYLRNARAAAGLQQKQLSVNTGLRPWRLSALEAGDADPTDDELLALTKALDLDLDHLLRLRELDDFEPAPAPAPVEPPTSAVVASAAPLAPAVAQLVRVPSRPALEPTKGPPASTPDIEALRAEIARLAEECAVLRQAVVFYVEAMDRQ